MAITVKPISQVERGGYRVVSYEAYQDGALAYTGALRLPLTADADMVTRKLLATATQRLAAQGGEPQDISALLGQELGAADVDPLNSLSDEELSLRRKRELQAALNSYLSKQADGTDRYTPYMIVAMSRAKDALDAAVAGGFSLTTGQQDLLDRLTLCETGFIGSVNTHYATQAAAIAAADRAALLAMTDFGFSQFDAADPDITMDELGG